MKKMLLLAMAIFLVGLFLGSVALAQGTTMIGGGTITVITSVDLGPTGGPPILLPGAALVLGAGVLTYTIIRRRI